MGDGVQPEPPQRCFLKILEPWHLESLGVKLAPLPDWRNVSLNCESTSSSRPTRLGLISVASACAQPAWTRM